MSGRAGLGSLLPLHHYLSMKHELRTYHALGAWDAGVTGFLGWREAAGIDTVILCHWDPSRTPAPKLLDASRGCAHLWD